MKLYYFLHAPGAEYSAPIYIVKVGRQRRDLEAHAELSARALLDDSYYYCVKSDESLIFYSRLLRENPKREVFRCFAHVMLNIIENRANAGHVENLSEHVRRCMATLPYYSKLMRL